MKRFFCFIAVLILLFANSCSAYAKSAYQQFWKPGVYLVTITEEEKQKYDKLWEKVLQMSEGTIIRESFDTHSIEAEYEDYLYMIKDKPLPEQYFDDLGTYTYACGLPDELSISQKDALYIAYYVMQKEYNLTNEELMHFLPFYSYFTADINNPAWDISFTCYDDSLGLSIVISIYAHDGSLRGIIKNTNLFG